MSILLIHVASVAVLALFVEAACRLGRFRPAICHALWLVVLAKLLVPPVVAWPVDFDGLSSTLSAWESETRTAASTPREPVAEASFAEGSPEAIAPNDTPPARVDSAAPPYRFPWLDAFAVLWMVGGSAYVLQQARKIVSARAVARRGEALPDWLQEQLNQVSARLGLPAPPAVVTQEGGAVHVQLAGKPVLVISADSLREVPADHWNTILTHELAHLKRRDHWVAWGLIAAGAIWWWNPLLWWVRRCLGLYSEMACDAWVVSAHPEARKQYAETMVHIMAMLSRQKKSVPAMGLSMWSSSTQERRLWMIMKSDGTCRMPGWAAAALVGLGLLSAPAWVAVGQPGNEPETVEAAARPVPAAKKDTPVSWRLSLEPAEELKQKLDSPVNIEFEDIHIKDVMEFIQDAFDTNIVLDQRVIMPESKPEGDGEESAAPVSDSVVTNGVVSNINLKDVPMRDAFRALLTPLNLTYDLRGASVWISSSEQIEKDRALPLPASRSADESDETVLKLKSPVNIEFEAIHIKDTMEFIQDSFDINVVIDSRAVMPEDGGNWDAPPIGSPGFTTDGLIAYINQKHVPLDQALYVLTRLTNLSYTVEPGFVFITSPELLEAGIPSPEE